MGTNVYNDVLTYNEKNPGQNGKKVVIIYTTAGNLHDSDDANSCNCMDPYDHYQNHIPYWKVREHGSKNSIHLAACRMGGWGANIPYPNNQTVIINGHSITRYNFKNTASYYLRIKEGNYGKWKTEPNSNAGTVDSSTTYTCWADFVNTLYYIYKAEMDSSMIEQKANFNYPDVNEDINIGDHWDHLMAGRAACEASKLLSANISKCFTTNLFVDYNTQNLPPNLSPPDIQNEAAMTGVYCMALLDYNAWPEWGSLYAEWDCRNYYRTITSCENPVQANLLAQDSLISLKIKVYPSPANNNLFLQFNLPTKALLKVRITDTKGATVFEEDTHLSTDNTISINTSSFSNGSYMLLLGADGSKVSNTIFEVAH